MSGQKYALTPRRESPWQKTPYANLVRYKSSEIYFARFRVQGKLFRRSLKTDRINVAKLRLADTEKQERQKASVSNALTCGKMTFGDTLSVFKTQLEQNPSVKASTREYYDYRIKALLKSWPDLAQRDVAEISSEECRSWSSKNAAVSSSSAHNHTVGLLRKVFEIARQSGTRYDNPATSAKRVKERTKKKIDLPEFDEFQMLVTEIGRGGSGHSKSAADLVEFLAYGGFRKTEAKFVTWRDCNVSKDQITVRGHPETGTKNSQVRRVPMITDMKTLLFLLKSQRKAIKPDHPVMLVFECQKSLDRATRDLGIERLTHHDLRHLFATRCIESGVDIPTVSRWLGHKGGGALAMKVYGHLRDQHSVEMAKLVSFTKQLSPKNNRLQACFQRAKYVGYILFGTPQN